MGYDLRSTAEARRQVRTAGANGGCEQASPAPARIPGRIKRGNTLTRQAAYLGALGVALALIAAAAAARADTTGQK